MIIGKSIPTTPRVGMAVATAIIAKIVTNSPRANAPLPPHRPQSHLHGQQQHEQQEKRRWRGRRKPQPRPLYHHTPIGHADGDKGRQEAAGEQGAARSTPTRGLVATPYALAIGSRYSSEQNQSFPSTASTTSERLSENSWIVLSEG